MHYRMISLFICLLYFTTGVLGQELENNDNSKEDSPVILYSSTQIGRAHV